MASLNSKIDWSVALREMGSRLNAFTLPASCACPICREGRLKLVQDISHGGAWAACPTCGFAGDILALASKVWKVNAESAFVFLQERRALSFNLKAKTELARREKDLKLSVSATNCVKQAMVGSPLTNNTGAKKLLSKLNISLEQSFSWATQGPGRIAGYASSVDVEDGFRPRRSTSPRRYTPRKSQVAPEGIENVILVPFWDVPGRIASVGMVYPNKHGKWAHTHHTVPQIDRWDSGGVAMHPGIKGERLLLTPNLELYFRTQLKHFSLHPKPLPLGCYREGDCPTTNWQGLANKELVFWSPDLSPQTLWFAIRLNAKIATVGPQGVTPQEYVRQRSAAQIVDNCFANAVAWPEIIAGAVEKKELDELSDWLGRMDLSEQEKHIVIDACPRDRRKKIKQAFNVMISHKSVTVPGGCMEQRAGGWYFIDDRSEQLVINSPFRVLEAIRGKQVQYRVEAHFNRTRFEFVTPQSSFNRRPFELVQTAAIDQGLGVPTFDNSWQSQAPHIAIQFHSPRVANQVDTTGLSNDGTWLCLPRITINTRSGKVKLAEGRDLKAPGATLHHRKRTPNLVRKFLQGDATHVSVFMATLSQILARLADADVPHVTLQGKSAVAAAKAVTAALGIPELDGTYSVIDRQMREHAWPVMLPAVHGAARSRLLDKDRHNGLILPASPTQALHGLLLGNTAHVRGIRPSETACELLKHWTVDLLAYACETRQLNLLHAGDGPVAGTYRIVRSWLRDHKVVVDNKTMYAAEKACLFFPHASEALAHGAAMMAHNGTFAIRRWGIKPKPNVLYRMPDNRDVFIPREAFLEIIQQHDNPRIPVDSLLLRLTESRPSVSLRLIEGIYGWVVNQAQFDSRYIAYSRQKTKGIRLQTAS